MIRALRRVSGILPLTRWLTLTATSIVIVVSFSIAGVHDAVHVVALSVAEIFVHAEARPAACTPTLALVVSRKRIAASESTAALKASMGALASVQFRVAFQVMQTTETCLARRAFVRLFLAVR